MAKRTYGCSSVVNAVCLQYELAGHGMFTDLKRSRGGLWLVEHAIKRITKPTFIERWLEQAPKELQ